MDASWRQGHVQYILQKVLVDVYRYCIDWKICRGDWWHLSHFCRLTCKLGKRYEIDLLLTLEEFLVGIIDWNFYLFTFALVIVINATFGATFLHIIKYTSLRF